jgi:hypothetical protein
MVANVNNYGSERLMRRIEILKMQVPRIRLANLRPIQEMSQN